MTDEAQQLALLCISIINRDENMHPETLSYFLNYGMLKSYREPLTAEEIDTIESYGCKIAYTLWEGPMITYFIKFQK